MRNVLEWLEADEANLPDKIAFADVNTNVSYADLARKARRAGTFIAQNATPRQPIALYMDKTVDAICALLGAAYAGCCYSFIDLRQPQARISKIVDKLSPAFVVVDDAALDDARDAFPADSQLVTVSELFAPEADVELLAARRAGALSTDPLYINFTSGTTGTPKGVTVGHASVISFIPTFCKTLGLTGNDVFANQAPLDFDVSVKDVFGSLALGATVHLIPRDYFSVPTQLLDYLVERKPTVLVWAVSAMCFVSIMRGFDYAVPDTVRLVAFSGEVMPPKQLGRWRAALPDTTFVNLYGPTEITCNCTYHVVDRAYARGEVIPMGKAFDGESVFLIDENGQLVRENEAERPGEIYVGGPELALGYYNDPERTAEAFVQNPLHNAYRDIVYKTGDLAHYDADGNLVYLSRVDHQIKHMGQRIELGEIEAAAHATDGVERACCIYDHARQRIRLYYTGTREKDELSAALHEALPPFMMPNTVKQLDDMPLTKNGKIDRAALAEQ